MLGPVVCLWGFSFEVRRKGRKNKEINKKKGNTKSQKEERKRLKTGQVLLLINNNNHNNYPLIGCFSFRIANIIEYFFTYMITLWLHFNCMLILKYLGTDQQVS